MTNAYFPFDDKEVAAICTNGICYSSSLKGNPITFTSNSADILPPFDEDVINDEPIAFTFDETKQSFVEALKSYNSQKGLYG